MADCVKLSVIDAIATALGTVADIAEVHMNETEQRRREEYQHPVAFGNCYEAETLESRNRLEVASFTMRLEIWAEGSAVHRTLENLRASVHKALYASSVIRALNAACRERRAEHLAFEDSDSAGAIVIEYEVRYLVCTVDPFTQLGF